MFKHVFVQHHMPSNIMYTWEETGLPQNKQTHPATIASGQSTLIAEQISSLQIPIEAWKNGNQEWETICFADNIVKRNVSSCDSNFNENFNERVHSS